MSHELTNYLLRQNVILTGTEGLDDQAHFASILLAEKDAQIDHLTADLAQANKWGGELQRKIAEKDNELEQHRKRVILCCHCGMAFGQEAGEKAEDALRRALEHERQCQRNPMVQELAEKDAEIERLRSLVDAEIKSNCEISVRELTACMERNDTQDENQRLRGALENMKERFSSIVSTDKTRYEYGDTNALGVKPPIAQCWLTPAEIAKKAITNVEKALAATAQDDSYSPCVNEPDCPIDCPETYSSDRSVCDDFKPAHGIVSEAKKFINPEVLAKYSEAEATIAFFEDEDEALINSEADETADKQIADSNVASFLRHKATERRSCSTCGNPNAGLACGLECGLNNNKDWTPKPAQGELNVDPETFRQGCHLYREIDEEDKPAQGGKDGE